MARDRQKQDHYYTPIKRLVIGVLIFFLITVFFVWRVDNPRVERLRTQILDQIIPNFSWAAAPIRFTTDLIGSFQSYRRIYAQNQEMLRELKKMQEWKERAQLLEQENARLLDLNNVRLDPRYTHITGVVLADSGSPFRQTVLINVGKRDGIVDGWAAMDGIGLVGRISGVGNTTSRVILLGDSSSRIPITIEPSNQRALMIGDNTARPPIEFLEKPDLIRPGDRVVTSGDGGVFPADLLIGRVVQETSGRLRVQLSADTQRLEFLRIIRHFPREQITTTGGLVGPRATPTDRSNANDGS